MKMVNGQQVVSLEVTGPAWNVIQAGLQELPFKIAQPVLADLQTQIQQQTQPDEPKTV